MNFLNTYLILAFVTYLTLVVINFKSIKGSSCKRHLISLFVLIVPSIVFPFTYLGIFAGVCFFKLIRIDKLSNEIIRELAEQIKNERK